MRTKSNEDGSMDYFPPIAEYSLIGDLHTATLVRRLDEGSEKQGWRMLLITRLVPLFPFNLQNYACGITRIELPTCILFTLNCIVPGTIVYTFAGGPLAAAREDLTKSFAYLGVAAVFFVMVSMPPGFLRQRSRSRR